MNIKTFCTFSLGISSSFYFATYLTQKGTISTLPLILAGLATLGLMYLPSIKGELRKLSRNEKLWIGLLFAYGIWGCLTVWMDNAAVNHYEIPAKFILGAIIAIPILKYGIPLYWIKAGVIFGFLSLAWLILQEYNGTKFSPIMNATKWGNAVAFQTMLAASLTYIERSLWQKIVFIGLASFGIYATAIIGTRGAFLPLLAMTGILSVLATIQFGKKAVIIAITSIVVLAFGLSQLDITKTRLRAAVNDFNLMQKDTHNTSIGVRLIMWKGGLEAGLKDPIIGHGYNFKEVFETYKANTPGEQKTVNLIRDGGRLFHNVYIDTFVTKGLIGILIFFSLLIIGLKSPSIQKFILILPATIGIAFAGLSDSTLALGITSTYFVVAGTILKATISK